MAMSAKVAIQGGANLAHFGQSSWLMTLLLKKLFYID
jgi:hypothetical protein